MAQNYEIDHDASLQAVKKMSEQVQAIRGTAGQILASVDAVKSGWMGTAASAYYNVQYDQIHPAIMDLHGALDRLSTTLQQANHSYAATDADNTHAITNSSSYLNV